MTAMQTAQIELPQQLAIAPADVSTRSSQSDLIDEAALAARLHVSRSTLQSWRYTRRGPRYLKIGRLIRYRNVDVTAFLNASARGEAA